MKRTAIYWKVASRSLLRKPLLAFLREHEKEYDLNLFLCHDQKHFDEPVIHQELAALNAKLVFSSTECIQTIRAYLPEK